MPLYYSPYRPEVYAEPLAAAKPGFEVAVNVFVTSPTTSPTALWPVKATLGFYIGGMGAKSQNFHTELMARMGYEEEAYQHPGPLLRGQAGRGDRSPCPTRSPTRSRSSARRSASPSGSQAWRDTPVTTILVGSRDPEVLRLMADLTT